MLTHLKALFSNKVFFSIFSKWTVISFPCVLLVAYVYAGQGDGAFYFFAANVLWTIICLRFATVIHELGHAAAAWSVSGTPRRMALGTGHEAHRFSFSDFQVVINARPGGGYMLSTWERVKGKKYFRWRLAVEYLGGVVANTIVALVLIALFGLDSFREGPAFVTGFIFANLAALVNLVPFQTTAFGLRQGTDGRQLIDLIFRPAAHWKKYENNYSFFESILLMEDKKYDEAVARIEAQLAQDPTSFYLRYNLSGMLVKSGDIDRGLETVRTMEDDDTHPDYKTFISPIANQLAWIYLLKGDAETALKYSAAAYSLARHWAPVATTHGCALILSGSLDEGIAILLEHADVRFVNSSTLTAAAALMHAYKLKGKLKSSGHYKNFVLKNIDKLDADDRMFFEQCQQRVSVVS